MSKRTKRFTNNPGPIEDVSKSIDYDTRIARGCQVADISEEDGAFTQVTTGDIALVDNPYLDDALIYDSDHAGGLFNGVLELRKAGNFTFRVVQIVKQSSGYLNPSEQAGAALVRFNLDHTLMPSRRFDIIKTYSADISQVA